MVRLKSATIYICLIVLLSAGLLSACNSSDSLPVPAETPESSEPVITNEPNSDEPQESPVASTEQENRVDVVYFHPKRRCGACVSIEIRTKEILEKNFQDAIDSGKITFQSYELEDPQNTDIIKKYGAVSSQLFINIVKDGSENIKHIEDVWMPQILNDGTAFDEFMNELLSQSLAEVT